jgi:hypothetical protein
VGETNRCFRKKELGREVGERQVTRLQMEDTFLVKFYGAVIQFILCIHYITMDSARIKQRSGSSKRIFAYDFL